MSIDGQLATGESVAAFAGSLTDGFGKAQRRFVVDAIEGIRRSRSLNLKCVASALNEDVQIHATEKRLSRHLGDLRLADAVGQRLLERTTEYVGTHTLLVVRTDNLAKKYATAMRLLDSNDVLTVDDGYGVCDIFATDEGIGRFVPIHSTIWSRNAGDFVSDSEEVLKAVRSVAGATGGKGMFQGDKLVALRLPREKVKSINLVAGDAEVEYRRRAVSVSQLRRNCSKPYGGWAYRYDGDTGVEDRFFLHYGVTAIHLSDVSRRLSFVAVESDEVNAAFLSANDMRHSRWDTYKTVYTGLEAMEAAKAFRNYKDRFDLASFRVLTYERLRFLMLLLHAAIYYDLGVSQEGLRFVPSLRFRPHAGQHRRNFVLPKEHIPRSQFVRRTAWHY